MQRTCLNCRRLFETVTDRAEYCSGRCRAAASRQRRREVLTAALDEAERALREIRLKMWGANRGPTGDSR